ncbi:MAG: phosphoethanolamine transferase [Muribaculaceae bacterium]
MPHPRFHRFTEAVRDTVRVYWPLWLALTLMLSSLAIVWPINNGFILKKLILLTFCCSAAYTWPLVLTASLIRRRCAVYIISGFVALWSVCCTLFPLLSGEPMNDGTLVMVLETDGREAASFIEKYITGRRIVCTLAYLLFLGGCIYLSGLTIMLKRRTAIITAVIAGLACSIGTYRIVYMYNGIMDSSQTRSDLWLTCSEKFFNLINLAGVFNGDIATATVATGYRLHRISSGVHDWEKSQREALKQNYGMAEKADSVNVVVIIGESFVRRHSNLYGYRLNTNPNLTALADSGLLTVFTDFISVGNYTNDAIRNIINLNSLGEGEQWYESVAFPLVAARSGWRVHLYENQVVKVSGLLDVQLSGILLNPIMKENVYEQTNDSLDTYDGDFIARINREFPFDGNTGNMDIFHLYGQHFEPVERYPAGKGHDIWNADSIPVPADKPWLKEKWRRQTVAEYDNATRYNDSVVASIIDRYRGTPTVFIYFSDHGDEIFDFGPVHERIILPPDNYLTDWVHTEFDIPLFIAYTPEYIKLFPESPRHINSAAGRPGSTDNIGHTILGLAGATDNRYYRADRDVLSPAYRKPRRMISMGLDYDEAVKKSGKSN